MSDGDEGEDALTASINTTPLVDIMLVLLIIFLITIPVVTHSVPVALPRERSRPNIANAQSIVLAIDRSGMVYWNDTALADAPALRTRLKERIGGNPPLEIQIRADKEVRYELVARVVAVCESAGIRKLAFMVEPEHRDAAREGG